MKINDRIIVTDGEHQGRKGTVTADHKHELATYLGIDESEVRVVLDSTQGLEVLTVTLSKALLQKELPDDVPETATGAAAPMKWFWMYTMPPRERIDELHLFPPDVIPAEMSATPVVAVPEGKWPLCWREREVILPKDMAHHFLMNVGGGNIFALVKYAGNTVKHCPTCLRIEKEAKESK